MKRPCLTHVGSDGSFSGYAYVWASEYSDERIQPGAFVDTLSKHDVKMLWQHEVECPIGVWHEIVEDEKGLFVRGQLDMNTEKGRETASLMASGAVNGLSLGYITETGVKESGKLTSTKIRLFEISVVTFPAMEEAVVDRATVQLSDMLTVDGLKRTEDGYYTANVRAARTGVQIYRGSEVGRPDMEFVKVYRPESEVFSKRSLKSYAHRPVTNDHPPVAVTADNWKEYSIGHVGDEVIRDGQFVRVPMVLMDAAAIADVEAGKRQLSLGYSTDLQFKSGVTKDGQEYDAIQTDIRANHLAVVAAARGGPKLIIGDDKKETAMSEKLTKTVTVDSLSVLTDDMGAQILQRHMGQTTDSLKAATEKVSSLEKQLADANTALAAAQAETAKVTETKDAEIAVMKKQLADSAITPEKLDTLVKDRAVVVGKARTVLGDKLVADGKSIDDIRKQVVDAKMGDAAKNYSVDAVTAAFNALTVDVKTTDAATIGNDPLARDLSFTADGVTHDADLNKAYADRDQRLRDAWKPKVA